MVFDPDIKENVLLQRSPELLAALLRDHTTGGNIRWCTHDYEHLGEGYGYQDEVKLERITGEYGEVIMPRVLKTKKQQADRVKGMAEVFTPIRVVKMMVENVEIGVKSLCLELTCGEAPFLVSRYDATTGEPVAIEDRVGILDRKLRLVNEQQLSNDEWLTQVRLAFQSTYGYEWQGDSLLLARENLLYTFVDHYEARFGCKPDIGLLQEYAEIISWNLWQMDGLTYRTPQEKNHSQALPTLFDEEPVEEPAPLCVVKDWQRGEAIKVQDIKNKQKDTMKFDVIIGNPPYQEEQKSENADGSLKNFAPPVYDKFMDAAFDIANCVELIHPARFLFNAGSTPKEWNQKMLNDTHFKVLLYEEDGSKIFPSLSTPLRGGVAITYRNSTITYGSIKTFTKYREINEVLRKVVGGEHFISLTKIIYSRTAYRFSDVMHVENPFAIKRVSNGHKYDISSNIMTLIPEIFYDDQPDDGKLYIQMLGRSNNNRIYKYIRSDYVKDVDNLDKYKVFVAQANGSGEFGDTTSELVVEKPGVGATETFLSIGAFNTKEEATCLKKYIKTKFARALLSVLKVTQNGNKPVWQYVPLQDFTPNSDIDWSKSVAEIDEQLFDKYGLDEKEREFIRTKVKEMK